MVEVAAQQGIHLGQPGLVAVPLKDRVHREQRRAPARRGSGGVPVHALHICRAILVLARDLRLAARRGVGVETVEHVLRQGDVREGERHRVHGGLGDDNPRAVDLHRVPRVLEHAPSRPDVCPACVEVILHAALPERRPGPLELEASAPELRVLDRVPVELVRCLAAERLVKVGQRALGRVAAAFLRAAVAHLGRRAADEGSEVQWRRLVCGGGLGEIHRDEEHGGVAAATVGGEAAGESAARMVLGEAGPQALKAVEHAHMRGIRRRRHAPRARRRPAVDQDDAAAG